MLPPCRRRGRSLDPGIALPAICRFGVHSTREDHRVEAEPGGKRCDPSKGGYHILVASQHQAAVDDDPEQLLVGLHGILLITPEGGRRVGGPNDSLIAQRRSGRLHNARPVCESSRTASLRRVRRAAGQVMGISG
jgi:hypothetical protein